MVSLMTLMNVWRLEKRPARPDVSKPTSQQCNCLRKLASPLPPRPQEFTDITLANYNHQHIFTHRSMFAILITLATLTLTTDARLDKSLPKIDPSTWNRYDFEFGAKFSPIHHSLASGDVSPVFAAEQFNFLLTEFLESKDDLTEEAKQFFAHNPEAQTNLESARKLKNLLKKRLKQTEATLEDKAKAKQGLRHYNFLLKKKKESEAESEVRKHEKAYKNNFHKYAKEITNNTFGQPSVSPTYTKDEANLFYRERYSTPKEINLTYL